jgi:C-3',4' desaturase CrtD
MKKILIIGAGFGGLAAAAELSRWGHDVTVLEAHIYPGGSAGTFFHQGYRFDAGATLAGGFAPGAVMDLLGNQFSIDWEASLTKRAMLVHLADGSTITRWTDPERWKTERMTHFGELAEPFWEWQENTAGALWDFALRLPPWPPQSIADALELAERGLGWLKEILHRDQLNQLSSIIPDVFNPTSSHIPPQADKLRQFIDAQLLISAQTTSCYANALYSSIALDLARQGVAHIPGGMGSMADKLVAAIEGFGGEVHFRQQVNRVSKNQRGQFLVETKRKKKFQVDVVVFNLPPWNIAKIMKEELPARLRGLPEVPQPGWGAFTLYVGLDNAQLPSNLTLHQQVIQKEPLAEGNSIFMSLSPEWDFERAPVGKRALTISTHTHLQPWWDLFEHDKVSYEDRKAQYTERVLMVGERVIPKLRENAELILSRTPITFERFTRRSWGWVGGFPQTSLFRSWGPQVAPGLWMVGDSIFPGQSVPAVMLAGLRVARAIEAKEPLKVQTPQRSLILRRTGLFSSE